MLAIINACLAPENERWSSRKLLDHPMFADEPDVLLLSVGENRTNLTMQLAYKSQSNNNVKFDYNVETDTAENVVREMIEENLLSYKFQSHVTNEIQRILRDFSRLSITEGAKIQTAKSPLSSDVAKSKTIARSPIASDAELEAPLRDYPNDFAIDEFIQDVAILTGRSAEKAARWLDLLQSQDIMMVGDLRALTEDDWGRLGLTVFASRAIRNAMSGRSAAPSAAMSIPPPVPLLSPKTTGLVPNRTGTSVPSQMAVPNTTTSTLPLNFNSSMEDLESATSPVNARPPMATSMP